MKRKQRCDYGKPHNHMIGLLERNVNAKPQPRAIAVLQRDVYIEQNIQMTATASCIVGRDRRCLL